MITGVILARNEEGNIVDCARALLPHVGELLLIDMESGDRTVELARPYVTRVLTHPLIPNFDSARNMAIPEARFDWLWFVDADERIPAATGQIVNQLVRDRSSEFEALNIPFKSFFCGQWMEHCGWWPGFTMPRVLKRGHFRFAERLHGGVELQGRELRLAPNPDWGVIHYSYRSVEHYIEKINRYTTVEARQMLAESRTWDWQAAVRHMLHELWNCYERNAGNLDRERGWILSWLSGQYRWLTHAKLLESAGPQPNDLTSGSYPADLDAVLDLMRSELSVHRAPTPELPLGIVWRGPIWDPSGYADESRCFVKALANGVRPLTVDEFRWSDKVATLAGSTPGLLKALLRASRSKYVATITNCICTLIAPDPCASLNVLRTTFETDRIPPHWHPRLEPFDEIWVISRHNELAFRRSGVSPEKLRVVPSCLDTELFAPRGEVFPLPPSMGGRFVFLSVFDWQLRKGWDILLTAYVRTFTADGGAGLFLKIGRAHGLPLAAVLDQADGVLARERTSLSQRSDIVLCDDDFTEDQMAALYRSASAFVLPSRGEGWGRPYLEAMASGLPTIGTAASGNVDFMTEENSFLIPAAQVEVPELAVREIPVYQGQMWFEPDGETLCRHLRTVFEKEAIRCAKAQRGCEVVRTRYNLASGTRFIEEALSAAERRFNPAPVPPARDNQCRVVLEGEFFAGHSFANINERLLSEYLQDPALAVAGHRVFHQPVHDRSVPGAHLLQGILRRTFEAGPQVTIRHAFPPNWQLPATGRWIHIQPWEYGHLPIEWVAPLRDHVDEIWAPSNYVRDVYVASGIPSEKIQVIPWGVDLEVFHPAAPALHLPTHKRFRFLFVGGTIPRKGFDVLLEAYLAEFRRNEDVCLVVKDLGTETFYRDAHSRSRIQQAMGDSESPEIVYLDRSMTPGQLASLYTATQCLVAPYRGEGFGLPILEAMACGVVPIVPRGGPSDDFTDEDTALRVPSRTIETRHAWPLCGPAMELAVSVADVRKAMRQAFGDPSGLAKMGAAASRRALGEFTWSQTARRMLERIQAVANFPPRRVGEPAEYMPTKVSGPQLPAAAGSLRLCVFVALHDDESVLAGTLSHVAPFVDMIVADSRHTTDRSAAIAHEYGARLVANNDRDEALTRAMEEADCTWVICLHPGERFDEDAIPKIRTFLESAEPGITAATLQIQPRDVSVVGDQGRNELRLFRGRPGLLAALMGRSSLREFLAEQGTQQVQTPFSVTQMSRAAKTARKEMPAMGEPWLAPYVPKQGDIFLDIGANVGTWSRWLAPFFRRVHAIEPNPDALAGLNINLPSNVSIHEWGAWDREELVRFSQFDLSVHLTAYFTEEGIHTGSRKGQIELPCRPVDSLSLDGKVTFIKCDTEGAEVRCLRGAQRLIERDRPWLLVECHSSENFVELMKTFSEWRYLATVVRDPHYEAFSKLWYEHCWFACQPMPGQ